MGPKRFWALHGEASDKTRSIFRKSILENLQQGPCVLPCVPGERGPVLEIVRVQKPQTLNLERTLVAGRGPGSSFQGASGQEFQGFRFRPSAFGLRFGVLVCSAVHNRDLA